MQFHKIQCNSIRYNSIPCSTIRCNAIQWNNMHFWPKNGNFRQLGPYNGLPNSRMGTYRKTKGIQSYLRIWGCYDPIESGPSETKKGCLYGCSVKKLRFWAQKGPLWAIGAMKRPAERPNGHLPENRRYPELPQDMGML